MQRCSNVEFHLLYTTGSFSAVFSKGRISFSKVTFEKLLEQPDGLTCSDSLLRMPPVAPVVRKAKNRKPTWRACDSGRELSPVPCLRPVSNHRKGVMSSFPYRIREKFVPHSRPYLTRGRHNGPPATGNQRKGVIPSFPYGTRKKFIRYSGEDTTGLQAGAINQCERTES